MALSKSHELVTLIAACRRFGTNEGLKKFNEIAAYAVLPDAIRCFKFVPEEEKATLPNNRVVSHFEQNPFSGEVSGMKFPDIQALKVLDEELIFNLPKKVVTGYQQSGFGDLTRLDYFEKWNEGLDEPVFFGCKLHLKQDRVFDKETREIIKITRKKETEDIFTFKDVEIDSKTARTIIGEIEQQQFKVLCDMLHAEFALDIDATWFDENVKPVLYRDFCPHMAESTYKYMTFGEVTNRHMTDSEVKAIIEKMIRTTWVEL